MKTTIFSLFSILISLNLMAQNELELYISKLDPEISVSMILQNSKSEILFEKNSKKQVPSASIIKIPILITFFQQVEEKKIKENQKYRLTEKDRVGGSGDIQFEARNSIFSYFDLATKMISVSDNTATNILINVLGMEDINERINRWEIPNTMLQRKMMDTDAVLKGKQNYTSATDSNTLLLDVLNYNILNKKNGKKALDLLLRCEDNLTIPRKLPKNIPIAHKTGTLDIVRGDSAIIFGNNTLILTIFVENFESMEQAELIIADLADISYHNFGK